MSLLLQEPAITLQLQFHPLGSLLAQLALLLCAAEPVP